MSVFLIGLACYLAGLVTPIVVGGVLYVVLDGAEHREAVGESIDGR
jgi:hypothetical protein